MTKIALLLALFVALPALAEVNIYVADHHNKTVIKIKEDGTLLWSLPNNNAGLRISPKRKGPTFAWSPGTRKLCASLRVPPWSTHARW